MVLAAGILSNLLNIRHWLLNILLSTWQQILESEFYHVQLHIESNVLYSDLFFPLSQRKDWFSKQNWEIKYQLFEVHENTWKLLTSVVYRIGLAPL
jgi:hypothetical protein